MDEQSIHERINALVAEEHELRNAAAEGAVPRDEEQRRLAALEQQLDQAWDLLRQRDGRRHAGEDPDSAQTRPVSEVEGYWQ